MKLKEEKTSCEVTTINIADHFADLPDPRGFCNAQKHLLMDILLIALCAMICGAESFTEMELFGRCKADWFQEHLGLSLSHGIPSHDTFGRVFAALDSKAFTRCFMAWTHSLQELTKGQVIALDGKTVRRSFDNANGHAALHVVSAWASKNRLSLGQEIVDAKSNEITAVPALLALLDIRGCTVTTDALNCQKDIARLIVDQGGDYVLALKDNHRLLHEEVEGYFDWARQRSNASAGNPQLLFDSVAETREYGHGRREIRRCWAMAASETDWSEAVREWAGLRSIVLVETERSVQGGEPGTSTKWLAAKVEKRCYLSSHLPQAAALQEAVRNHWGIENSLHWVLDVAFHEDDCRIRKDNAPANMTLLRQLALNLIRQVPIKKIGVKARRMRAGWDTNYMMQVLTAGKS